MDILPVKLNSYLIVATVSDEKTLHELESLLRKYDKHVQLRSCIKNPNGINCIFETSSANQFELFENVSSMNNVTNANIILNDGNNRLG